MAHRISDQVRMMEAGGGMGLIQSRISVSIWTPLARAVTSSLFADTYNIK